MPIDPAPSPVAGVALRAIEPRDHEFLRALYRSARDEELAQTGWDEMAKRAFTDSQFDLQDRWYRQQYPDARLWVIEEHGAPIGRLYLSEFPGELRLMEIALVSARRGAGLGTALVEWVQGLAAAQARAVTLYVEPLNRARSLYSRLGFAEESSDAFHVRMRWAPAGLTSG